jgi:four helix bundle protein
MTQNLVDHGWVGDGRDQAEPAAALAEARSTKLEIRNNTQLYNYISTCTVSLNRKPARSTRNADAEPTPCGTREAIRFGRSDICVRAPCPRVDQIAPANARERRGCPAADEASGSVGANYIEANESISKRDFVLRIKICRKEAKEARYWLRLVDTGNDSRAGTDRNALVQEATELTRIFGAILRKMEGK